MTSLSRRSLLCAAVGALAPGALPAAPAGPCTRSPAPAGDARTLDAVCDPRRLAVNDYAVLDALQAWGLDDRIVCAADPAVLGYLKPLKQGIVLSGGLKNDHRELLERIKPDLIFVSARLSRSLPGLRSIAPAMSLAPDYSRGAFKSYRENLRTLAAIFGLESRAEEEIAAAQQRAQELTERLSGKTHVVLMVNNARLHLLPPGGRASFASDAAGLVNLHKAAAGAGGGRPARMADAREQARSNEAVLERVLALRPDFVLVLNKDLAVGRPNPGAVGVLAPKAWRRVEEAFRGRIAQLHPQAWYLGEGGVQGCRIMLGDLERLAARA